MSWLELCLVALIIINYFFNFNQAIYTIFTFLYGNFITKPFQKPKLLDESRVKGICLSTDLDIFWHMNNSKYLQAADIARIKLWTENGIWDILRKSGSTMLAGGHSVRYRKPISLFTTYTIKTKVLYWDDNAFYLEQLFSRNSDGFICCLLITKHTVVGVEPDHLVQRLGYPVTKPEVLPEVSKWIESVNLSSERLRKKC